MEKSSKPWEEHGLTEEEYNLIKELIGKEPNEVELGIFGTLWSEHCSYKSSRKHLRKFPTSAPWVVQGPGENAGVIEIDENVWVAFKIESHNHPSYIEPYHGAATGVGGIIRDILSMGARPIALTDSLRFGDIRKDQKSRELNKGVVKGIGGYGNPIGVPTVGGDTFYEDSYKTNPLVNAFCLGIISAGKMYRARATAPGQILFLIGSETGRDGIKGATMASAEFSEEDIEGKRPNVQIGDPFYGKKLIEAIWEIISTDEKAVVGMQDLGAAGLAGSASELAAKSSLGVELHLENVPLREEGMTPFEILLSESQERMLLVTTEDKLPLLEKIAKKWHLPYAVVGKTTEDKRFKAYYKGELIADLPVEAIVDKAPVYDRPYKEPEYLKEVKNFNQNHLPEVDIKKALIKVLSSPNVANKKWIYYQYDYQVGTNTVYTPGGDAAVIRLKWKLRPEIYTEKGVVISNDGNGRLVYLDPYKGGKWVVAEACRNVACVGAKPLAITDNLNFGNPERPEIMYQLVKAIEGMAEACEVLETPVISGNVSLYNETVTENEIRNIYPTPVVVAVGVLEDYTNYTPSVFQPNNTLYLIGDIEKEPNIAGSEFLKEVHELVKGDIPDVDLQEEKKLINTLIELNNRKLITGAHDVSLGGLITTVVEGLFHPETTIGANMELYTDGRLDFYLFAENPTRVVVSVEPSKEQEFEEFLNSKGVKWLKIGTTTEEPVLKITNNGEDILEVSTEELRKIYDTVLENILK
jgi:phosphoribosylformylglycinamidine synthase II